METYTDVFGSYVRSLIGSASLSTQEEVLYEETKQEVEDWISNFSSSNPLRPVFFKGLATVGKGFERAVISRSNFNFHHACLTVEPLHTFWVPRIVAVLVATFFEEGSGTPLFSVLDSENKELADRFRLVRQLLLGFSKVQDIEPSIREEEEISLFKDRMTSREFHTKLSYGRNFLLIARALLRELFYEDGKLCAPLAQWDTLPFGRHGPGAVADRSVGREKWVVDLPPARIHAELFDDVFGRLPSVSLMAGGTEDSVTSRLIRVPKDLTKNRLICAEPKELMFGQQGLMRVLYDHICTSPLTRRAIHLFDQSHNFYASRRKRMSTIDLSDASDRLSIDVCRLLLPREVFKLLTRYRSSFIELPDGERISYYAMATMGNALCFPIESVMFWAISLASMLDYEVSLGTYESVHEVVWLIHNRTVEALRRYKIWVFGDDIVVPDIYFRNVCGALEEAGLHVNHQKSCDAFTTPVRESCGAFWWGEYDVRIVKFSFSRLSDAHSFVAFLGQLPQLGALGFGEVEASMAETLEQVYPVPSSDPVSIRKGIKGGWIRWNEKFQQLEVRVLRETPDESPVRLNGEIGLYAWFVGAATQTFVHRNAQSIKWTWVLLSHLNGN